MKLLSSFIFAHVKIFIWALAWGSLGGLVYMAVAGYLKAHDLGIPILPLIIGYK